MIPAHLDREETRSFLSCWLELRRSQSRIYPNFDWLLISAVILDADIAGRSPLDSARIAAIIAMPERDVYGHLKDMRDSGYVRPAGAGWVPDDGAWFALEMFMPAFRRILRSLDPGVDAA